MAMIIFPSTKIFARVTQILMVTGFSYWFAITLCRRGEKKLGCSRNRTQPTTWQARATSISSTRPLKNCLFCYRQGLQGLQQALHPRQILPLRRLPPVSMWQLRRVSIWMRRLHPMLQRPPVLNIRPELPLLFFTTVVTSIVV